LFLARYTGLKPVNRSSLRVLYVGATLATSIAALTTEPALAHVDVRPRLIEQKTLADVRVELPPLRPSGEPDRLEVEGIGIEVLSVRAQGKLGADTVWTVRLRANGEPGITPIVLRAVYPDGQSVEVDQQLTVVPAPEGAGFPWPGVVAGVLLAVSFAAVALQLARRKA
jgi:hypothetical protein